MRYKYLFVLLIISLLYLFFNINTIEQFSFINKYEIVVSRYNEDLEWLKDEPFNKYPVIIYNKGINDTFYKPPLLKYISYLNNIGRTSHTILYHIITHYDNLSDVTIFLHGSTNEDRKYTPSKNMIYKVEKTNNSVFSGVKTNNVQQENYNFTIDEYTSSNLQNASLNNENILEQSNIRPFGKWYESLFGNIVTSNIAYCDIISVSKHHIKQHPKKYYIHLINQVNNSSSPEAGHYFERAWEAVFYPMNELSIV